MLGFCAAGGREEDRQQELRGQGQTCSGDRAAELQSTKALKCVPSKDKDRGETPDNEIFVAFPF